MILVAPIGPLKMLLELEAIRMVGKAFTLESGIVIVCAVAPVEVIEMVPAGADVAAAEILTKIAVFVTEPELWVNVTEEE